MKKLLIALFLLVPSAVYAQVSPNFWHLSNSNLIPNGSTWGIAVPSLSNLNCIGTNGSGVFGAGTCSGGSGGATSTNPLMATYFVSTSTLATTTFAGPVRITSNGLTTTPTFFVGTSTNGYPLYGQVQGDVLDGEMDFNGTAAINIANANTGSCASSGLFGDGNIVALNSDYSFFGFTNSGWTGSGCAFGNGTERPESTVISNPTGDMNFELASTSNAVGYKWYTQNTNLAMYLSNKSGNLGIGTSTPATTLSVAGNGYFTGSLGLGMVNTVGSNGTLDLLPSTNDTGFRIFEVGTSNSGVLISANTSRGHIILNNNSSDIIDLNGNPAANSYLNLTTGNFGIGTTTPQSALAVSGGATFGADYNKAAPTNGLLVEGNVGIGTTSATSVFTVKSGGNTITDNAGAVGTIQILNTLGGASVSTSTSGGIDFVNANNFGWRIAGADFLNSNAPLLMQARANPNWVNVATWSYKAGGVNNTFGLGLGTTTPIAVLDMVGQPGSTIPLLNVASLSATNATTTLFTILNNGNIGISTTTPFWALTIATSTGPQLALADSTASSNAWTLRSISNSLYIATSTATATSTTPALTINPNGFVGVATSSPGSLLSISNIANFTGATTTFYSTGGIALTGGCITYTIGGSCIGGTGTVTSITGGTGLNGGTITTSGTLSLKAYLSTTTADTSGQVLFWTSTNATPATIGSNSGFTFATTGSLLTATNASTTQLTAGSANRAISGLNALPIYVASSTWGTGTTTITILNNINGMTWVDARCSTDAGSLETRLYTSNSGFDIMYWSASTTKNTLTFASNNILSTATTTSLDIGNAASSPTKFNCTLEYMYNSSS